MKKSLSNLLTLVFALIGCLVALVLTLGERINTSATGCFKSGEGCASTTGSTYGHLGPVPTAVLGLLMYVAFVVLCLARGRRLRAARDREALRAAAYATSAAASFDDSGLDGTGVQETSDAVLTPQPVEAIGSSATTGNADVRTLDMAIWGLALLGFGISIWLQYVAIYQLQSFCKYCFASATLVTLIFALASRDYLLDGRKLSGEQKMIGGVLAMILVLGSFIVVPDILGVISKRPVIAPKPVPDARGPLTASMLHSKGDPNARYTLIEFADYQCSHCADANKELDGILKPFAKDIRLVFRNYPLHMIHKWGIPAAAAAEAAGEQGKFWEMHNLLFAHQKDLDSKEFTDADFDKYAAELHLNTAKFDKDRQSEAIQARVRTDIAAGDAGGIQSTPTFFFVSPKHVTSLPGTMELNKFLNKPHTQDWE